MLAITCVAFFLVARQLLFQYVKCRQKGAITDNSNIGRALWSLLRKKWTLNSSLWNMSISMVEKKQTHKDNFQNYCGHFHF
jgi:hypothetical protein